MLPNFGATELLIFLVIVLALFGGGKIAGVGKSLGTAIKDFKHELKDAKNESKDNGDSNDDNPTDNEKE